ncbi:MAG TPA: hemolysin family protein [Candidatus Blautia stercoripullorum]|uniref:Hemolysin family protein n=1 Tax=Candidatus Blautia stercoripullorum TaxID=2838502 RepID=A0A9D2R6E8_9FIRM|nr:hemolysin family protein [Candidatus Blautia stercoripullorum]
MDSSDVIQFLILIILICLSAFFSSAETSMTTVNKIRIQSLSEEGDARAKTLLKVIEDSGKLLSTILIGNNVVNLSASSLATTLTMRLFGNAAVSISTGIITLLVLIFGEITPKTLASVHGEGLALAYAKPIYILMTIMTPVIFLMNHISGGVLRLLGTDPHAKSSTITEHELRTLVNVGHEEGVIKTEERQMINNVFDFDDSRAEDIMVPRIDVTFADINSTYEDLIRLFREDKHTRFPVYKDSTDNIVGIANIKDLLLCDKEDFSLKKILREPYFTYEYKKTSELLMEMKENSVSFAIVLDEYGATSGIITLENLVEEIVGDIHDEYEDQEEEEIKEIIPGREYVAVGSARLDDLNETLHLDLSSEDYDSIGGYMIEQLDRFPEEGETVVTESGVQLTADKVERTRIASVRICLPPSHNTDEKEKEINNN